jgi:hypothetical protein
MAWRSILKPSDSVVMSAATVGGVFAVYQLHLGNVNQAHATDANHPANETSRKKAGYTALAFVAGLTLITKDANVGILGGGTIIAMELSYRHAIMAAPVTGQIVAPDASQYTPPGASNVYPMPSTAAG